MNDDSSHHRKVLAFFYSPAFVHSPEFSSIYCADSICHSVYTAFSFLSTAVVQQCCLYKMFGIRECGVPYLYL